MARASNDGASLGSKLMVQTSGAAGVGISARRLSCARLIAASATMTRASLLATSAWAWTMSIGAIVPISTRFWLSSQRLPRQLSDSCCAFRLLIEYRDPGTFRTLRSVCVTMLSDLDVGQVAHLLAECHLLPNRIDLEVAQQRLLKLERHVQRRPAGECIAGSLVVNRELFQLST